MKFRTLESKCLIGVFSALFSFSVIFFGSQANAAQFYQDKYSWEFNRGYSGDFPVGPHEDVTPGDLCGRPDTHRYPEQIPYCSRDVDSSLKREIIRMYDQRFGYRIGQMDRQEFKIDHYIPLCAGGSNESQNLWPQHRSVYEITDPLEQEVCEKMAQGRLIQSQAVQLFREAKNDLSRVDAIRDYVSGL